MIVEKGRTVINRKMLTILVLSSVNPCFSDEQTKPTLVSRIKKEAKKPAAKNITIAVLFGIVITQIIHHRQITSLYKSNVMQMRTLTDLLGAQQANHEKNIADLKSELKLNALNVINGLRDDLERVSRQDLIITPPTSDDGQSSVTMKPPRWQQLLKKTFNKDETALTKLTAEKCTVDELLDGAMKEIKKFTPRRNSAPSIQKA